MKFDSTRELTERDVKEHVQDILDHGGELILSKHARVRMAERGYSFRDIVNIVRTGNLANTEFNDAAKNWKYTFRGPDLDGDEGAVVIALSSLKNCVVISLLSS